MRTAPPRDSSAADLEAFADVCQRLRGFDPLLGEEHVDGALCALAAAPRAVDPSIWLPALFGDSFERAFADPDDHARGLQVLQARLRVLCQQLDPEALFDEPDELRLNPWMGEWTDADRQAAVAAGGTGAEIAPLLQTGVEWAASFLDAVQSLGDLWQLPDDVEAAALFDQAFTQIGALTLRADSDAWRDHVAAHWPVGPPSRDELIGEACMSVQDLRMYWVDFAPRPPTRRVEAAPGRNDPCPCGSGKKFKKCHGA